MRVYNGVLNPVTPSDLKDIIDSMLSMTGKVKRGDYSPSDGALPDRHNVISGLEIKDDILSEGWMYVDGINAVAYYTGGGNVLFNAHLWVAAAINPDIRTFTDGTMRPVATYNYLEIGYSSTVPPISGATYVCPVSEIENYRFIPTSIPDGVVTHRKLAGELVESTFAVQLYRIKLTSAVSTDGATATVNRIFSGGVPYMLSETASILSDTQGKLSATVNYDYSEASNIMASCPLSLNVISNKEASTPDDYNGNLILSTFCIPGAVDTTSARIGVCITASSFIPSTDPLTEVQLDVCMYIPRNIIGYVILSKSNIIFNSLGAYYDPTGQSATATFDIDTNKTWSISIPSADTWLTVDKMTGTGIDTVTPSVAENTTGANRSSVITVTTSDRVSASINVTQYGTSSILYFDKTELNFKADGTPE